MDTKRWRGVLNRSGLPHCPYVISAAAPSTSSASGARGGAGAAIERRELPKLPWTSWSGAQKVNLDGKTYAKVGNRLYTRHAVDRMQPATLGTPAGSIGSGRNIAPSFVESIISKGVTRVESTPRGVQRTIFMDKSFEVITEAEGKIIVTIKRIS